MRWRRGRGLEELSRTAGPVARVVLREWLPPLGHGSRDGLLRSMSDARLVLHPLGEPRYDRLRSEPGLGGPGVASSYVIKGERD